MTNARPPARLGVAQLQPRAVRALVATRTRADRRRRGHRAFLDRLRHEAGAGERHRAGRLPAHASRTWRRRSARYEDERRIEVLRLQSAARNSMEWFENVERYLHLDPVQFNYSLLTRSQRISHENLRAARPALAGRRRGVVRDAARPARSQARPRAPMFAPFRVREVELENRVVVSPMAQYRAVDGTPTRLALRALRRARQGRRRAGHDRDDLRHRPRAASRRAAPASTRPSTRTPGGASSTSSTPRPTRKSACQLGHSGPKGSTQLGWETMDAPLASGNWQVIGAVAPCRGRRPTRSRAR